MTIANIIIAIVQILSVTVAAALGMKYLGNKELAEQQADRERLERGEVV